MEDAEFIKPPGNVFEAKRILSDLGLHPVESLRNIDIGKKKIVSDDLADRIYGFHALWCLGCLGSSTSARTYADAIERHVADTPMPEAQATHFLAVAANWRLISERTFDMSAAMQSIGGTPESGDDPQQTEQEFGILPEKADVDTGFLVLPAIGDPQSSEGRGLVSRLAPILGKKVPRKGLVPSEGTIRAAVEKDFPWAVSAAEIIENSLSIIRNTHSVCSYTKPLLFVGPPGTGKTSLAIRIAELLGRHYVSLTVAGAIDTATLAATPRGWSNFRVSLPVQAILESRSCDPCILVNEIEKSSRIGGPNGSAMGALLALMDRPASYYDTALMANIDLSHVLYMATANSVTEINSALVDRFTIIPVSRPGPQHFDHILARMRTNTAKELGLHPEALPHLDGEEYGAMKSFFISAGGSLRMLSSAYEIALKSALERNVLPTLM